MLLGMYALSNVAHATASKYRESLEYFYQSIHHRNRLLDSSIELLLHCRTHANITKLNEPSQIPFYTASDIPSFPNILVPEC
jgi:hypothetical protein